MNTHCQPLPRPVAEELLQVVTRAICDRPTDNAPQRESRTRQMIHAVMGFEPRDGLEYMLATIAFGHFQVILDSMRDLFQGQSDVLKAKNKTTIVALDRMMLEMFKELRMVRRRPMAASAADAAADEARRAAAAGRPAAASAVAVAAEAAMPEAVPAAPVPVAAGVASVADSATPAAVRSAALIAATPGTVLAGPDGVRSATAEPDGTPPGFAAFARTMTAVTRRGAEEHGPALAAPTVVPVADAESSVPTPDGFADDIAGFLAPPAEADAGTFEEHIAAFEAAYAATMEVLAEARALEHANTEEASAD